MAKVLRLIVTTVGLLVLLLMITGVAYGSMDIAENTKNGRGYGVTTLISDKSRVIKGGSWNDRAYWLSPGTRRYLEEDQASSTIGFRCAMIRAGSNY